MRTFKIYKILLPLLLGLFLTAFMPLDVMPPFQYVNRPASIDGAMEEYIETIEGQWIGENRGSTFGTEDKLRIEINRSWIYRDKVKIKVSEYCQSGLVEYLIFELRDNKLHYIAAGFKGHSFPLLYLDFMEITYEVENGGIVLYYESCEAEMENHMNRRLLRDKKYHTRLKSIL